MASILSQHQPSTIFETLCSLSEFQHTLYLVRDTTVRDTTVRDTTVRDTTVLLVRDTTNNPNTDAVNYLGRN